MIQVITNKKMNDSNVIIYELKIHNPKPKGYNLIRINGCIIKND